MQVDVFSRTMAGGNPLAVVIDADDLDTATMARFANWTNLSETAFLLKPTVDGADYRVRIFTPFQELPFAGHPTLGSCYVWLQHEGRPRKSVVIQECAAGLIRIKEKNQLLSFKAPDLTKAGPIEEPLLERVIMGLGLTPDVLVEAHWVDNGPGWMALRLRSRRDVLEARPSFSALSGLRVGIFAACSQDEADADFEVRAFTAAGFEDPVTGSLNAGLAKWLFANKSNPSAYVAAQGTVLGRTGRVIVENAADGIWVGGNVSTSVRGIVYL